MKTLLVRIGILAIVFALGAGLGYRYANTACKAGQAEAQVEAIETHDKKADVGKDIERITVQRAVKTEAVFSGIQQGVITYAQNHPAATDCHIGADGMRLWVAANEGADALATAERNAVLRGITAAEKRCDDRSAGKPYCGSQSLSPLQGSAQRVSRLVGEGR